jgi:hypothetical protein
VKDIRIIGGKEIEINTIESVEWKGMKKGYAGELVEMNRADIINAPYNPRTMNKKILQI